ncbi:tyrosine-protein kinase STYK1 isoform X2 [Bombina bombina]|uniref:tyrosine-protein kinase STYK1 isoform X2 n=1 Tax=Bombina bombina TaxID=8345 RepID=UPI00235B205F|nr:tyrosine-protein kinase STYK1 isoform X2 [Bombina bombina]
MTPVYVSHMPISVLMSMESLQILSNNSTWELYQNEFGVITIPALLSASTILVVFIILWKTLRKGSKKRTDPSRTVTDDTVPDWAVNEGAIYENTPGLRDSVLEKWELPSEWCIQDRVILCMGHYGPISRAHLKGEGIANEKQEVVLKELSESASPGETQDFIDLMRFHVQVCNHDNLVKMLWCRTETSPLCLVLKAVRPGNLLRFLWRSREGGLTAKDPIYKITEKQVYSMATQVASGLEYLSGLHNLVHGFVAACNVLIHHDLSVQLCGLGLAASMHRTGRMPARRAAQVPIKWQSPERLAEGSVSEKSDVWSFGILLYEIVTLGAPPYPNTEPQDLLPKHQKTFHMEQPDQCTDSLYEVMRICWRWDPSERPSFTDLMKKLQNNMSRADDMKLLTATDSANQSDYEQITGIIL